MPNGGLFVFREAKVLNTRENDLLTRDEVLELLKIGRTTLYRLMESHGFPRPIKVLEQSNRWLRLEIDAWLEQKPRAQIQVREPAPSPPPPRRPVQR